MEIPSVLEVPAAAEPKEVQKRPSPRAARIVKRFELLVGQTLLQRDVDRIAEILEEELCKSN